MTLSTQSRAAGNPNVCAASSRRSVVPAQRPHAEPAQSPEWSGTKQSYRPDTIGIAEHHIDLTRCNANSYGDHLCKRVMTPCPSRFFPEKAVSGRLSITRYALKSSDRGASILAKARDILCDEHDNAARRVGKIGCRSIPRAPLIRVLNFWR